MIEIENLTKSYGNFQALKGISLKIKAGEIFGFLGVNGAGKTTTLKMLAGLLKPTSGRIVLGGYDIQLQPLMAKAITGYIPDRPHLYNKLTGREFLYFVADLYSVSTNTAEKRIDELLEEYTLIQWQDELIENYSHGMKQRLATCAALIHSPKILVVDEPMVGLDPHGAKLLKENFKKYAQQGMSILLSTHSLNVAEEVSDRLAIIHQGKIITTGTVAQVKAVAGGENEALETVFLELTQPQAEV